MKNFLVYKSSAGAGKTYTLVRHYLALAFSPTPQDGLSTRFSRILAITFTNKAAAEMKSRILSYLREIMIDGPDSSMANDLCSDLGITIDDLRCRAQVVHRSIIHNYSDLAVCTIDSFMHRVVRTFAHDLDIPVNFNVQIENQDLIQAAIDELFTEVGSQNQELTDMLTSFVDMRVSQGEKYRIEGDVVDLCKELFQEKAPNYIERLKGLDFAHFKQIQQDFATKNEHFEKQVISFASQIKNIFDSNNITSDLFPNNGEFYKQMSTLSSGDFSLLKKERKRMLGQLAAGAVRLNKTTPAEIKALFDSVAPLLTPILGQFNGLLVSDLRLYNTRIALLSNLLSLSLMNHLHQLVQTYSVENEVLHISEFNKRISSVVEEDDVSPYLYERLGTKYINFLIDEFQDTSYLQWHNLVPLLANGLSQNQFSLVVGDAKQAIYRFRQGDVRQFLNLPQVDNSHHSSLLNISGKVENLPFNRRSRRHVVEFNNNFFGWVKQQPAYADNSDIQRIYEEHEQQVKRQGGCVNIATVENDQMLEQIYQAVVRLVTELHYDYRDIAIITYRKKPLSDISDYLSTRLIDGAPIPLVSSESFLLSNSQVVCLLRSMMGYLLNPDDKLAALQVVDYLRALDRLPADCYDRILEPDSLVLERSLQLLGGYSFDIDFLLGLPIIDCVEHLLRIFKLQGFDTAYVSTFINFVNDYSRCHRQDLTEFLEFFDKKFPKLSSVTAGDLNAINLFTIHKAKGLEAEVIIYPVFNDGSHSSKLWVENIDSNIGLPVGWVSTSKDTSTLFDADRDAESANVLMDKLNLLYVALTRPKDKLLVFCSDKEKEFRPLLENFATEQVSQGLMSSTDGGYLFGTMVAKEQEPSDPDSNPLRSKLAPPQKISMSNIVFPAWEERVRIADQSAGRSLSESQEDSIRRGLQVHELLSHVLHLGDQEDAVTRYVAAHQLSQEEGQVLLSELNSFLSRPEVQCFFQPGLEVKTECPLVHQGREMRIDRLVVLPDATHVIDFKTGASNLDHEHQVQRYVDAIASMGFPNVQSHLLYI